jgi:hypothetical protein
LSVCLCRKLSERAKKEKKIGFSRGRQIERNKETERGRDRDIYLKGE